MRFALSTVALTQMRGLAGASHGLLIDEVPKHERRLHFNRILPMFLSENHWARVEGQPS